MVDVRRTAADSPWRQAIAVAEEIGLDFYPRGLRTRGLPPSGWRSNSSTAGATLRTNVTNDDPLITGKIAWAHLLEMPDYYERLEELERAVGSTG